MLFFPTRDLPAWLDLLPVNDMGCPRLPQAQPKQPIDKSQLHQKFRNYILAAQRPRGMSSRASWFL